MIPAPDVVRVDRDQADDRRGERTVLDVLYALLGASVMGIDAAGRTTTILASNRVATEPISDLVQLVMSC